MPLPNMYTTMLKSPGDKLELTVERSTLQVGRSFSEEALDHLFAQMETWVGTRIVRRWDRTGEPPTIMTVKLEVIVS